MKCSLKFQFSFEKEAKRLGKRYPSMKSDIASLCEEIMANPNLGTDLGGGLRKIRMAIASKGRGKGGGVITFSVIISVEETEVNLLTIYDKSERESISRAEIEHLLEKNGLR